MNMTTPQLTTTNLYEIKTGGLYPNETTTFTTDFNETTTYITDFNVTTILTTTFNITTNTSSNDSNLGLIIGLAVGIPCAVALIIALIITIVCLQKEGKGCFREKVENKIEDPTQEDSYENVITFPRVSNSRTDNRTYDDVYVPTRDNTVYERTMPTFDSVYTKKLPVTSRS